MKNLISLGLRVHPIFDFGDLGKVRKQTTIAGYQFTIYIAGVV